MNWKHAATLLLVIALAVTLGRTLFDRTQDEADGGEGQTVVIERSDPSGTQNPADDRLAEVTPGDSDRAAARTESVDASSAAETSTDTGADLRPLTVLIEWPDGPAPAEGLIVYALRRDIDGGQLARTLTSTKDMHDDAPASVFEQLEDPLKRPEAIRAAILAEVPVSLGQDGHWSAKLEIPADRARVFLHAFGGGAFTLKSTEVFQPEESVTLRPEVGARIELTVRTGEGLSDVALDRTRVRLRRKKSIVQTMDPNTPGASFGTSVNLGLDGSVSFETVPSGVPLEVKLRNEAFVAIDVSIDALQPGETRVLEVVALTGAQITGRVEGSDGRGAAGVRVTGAKPGKAFGFDDEVVSRAVTDTEGRFVIDHLPDGPIILRADADHALESSRVRIKIEDGGHVADIVLTLDEGRTITGFARYASGEAAVGVAVEATFDVAHIAGPSGLGAMRGTRAKTTAGNDGGFRLTGLGAGPFSVRATGSPTTADSRPWNARADGVRPGAKGVVLELQPPLSIAGDVVDESGTALANITVDCARLVAGSMGDMRLDQRMAKSDKAGHFSVDDLVAATYQLVAIDPSADLGGGDDNAGLMKMIGSMDMASAEVVEGETVVVYIGAPPAEPVDVYGRVERAGEPYSDAMVVWIPTGKAVSERVMITTTDADGAYRITLDEPSDFLVSVARMHGGAGQQETVEFNVSIPPGTSEHEHDFEVPSGTLAGRVIGPDGDPVSGARLTVMEVGGVRTDRMVGGSYAEVPTTAQGTFEVSGLRAGTYQIAAGGASQFGSSSQAPARTIIGDFTLEENGRVDGIEIQLSEPGSVEVSVRDGSGKGVADAAIFLRDEKGRHTELISMIATDAGGKATISGLAPGSYTVAARGENLASQESAPFSVVAGRTAQIEVLLEPGGTIIAVLRSKGDATIPAARVQVLDMQGRDVSRRFGLAEMQSRVALTEFSPRERRIGPVPPGRYRVLATAADGRTAKKYVVIGASGERRVSLVLR